MEVREWEGRTGESWATEWRRTDRSFAGLNERLFDLLREQPFARAVDVGCGAGELSLALARARPDGTITGVDISADLVAVARERAADADLANLSFAVADAASWRPAGDESPGLIASRHGVMFFEDPHAAFANLAALAAPGARLVFSCFRAAAENPFFAETAAQLPPQNLAPGDPRAPGPFAFAERSYVEEILHGAGWRDVTFEPYDFAMVAGAGADPVEDAMAYWSSIGPAAVRLADMDEAARDETLGRIRALAERNCRDGTVALGAAAWIVTARKD